MRIEASTLAALWDRGNRAPAREHALLLLELALPGRTRDELARLSLGQRDVALVRLRRELFGGTFEGYVDCPSCRERLEIALDLPDRDEPDLAPRTFTSPSGLRFRAPDSEDLVAISRAPTIDQAMQALLTRCCTNAEAGARPAWGPELVAEVDEALAAIEGEDALSAEFTCPACGHAWSAFVDPATWLWEEVQAHAIDLLESVHRLATAYGWGEREILALPASRRSLYLGLIAP